jgi:uncharacterized membrane protein
VTAPPDEPGNRRPHAGSRARAVGRFLARLLLHGMLLSLFRGLVPSPVGAGADAAETDSPEVEEKAADRVIFFSDAVVAIAITLLALELPVPNDSGATLHQYLSQIGKSWEVYAAFLISFVVIATHWNGHRRVFRYVDRLAGPVVGLNMTWLLMMILTPFGARLLDSNGGFPIRFTTYAVIQVIALFCLLRINQEVNRRDLLRADTPDSFRHRDSMPTRVSIAMFLLSIPVSFVTEWSFAFWGAVPLVVDATRRVRVMRGIDPDSEKVF